MKKLIFTLIIFTISLLPLLAQHDSIPGMVTDRPTASISPNLVGKGFFQIETGVIYLNRKDNSSTLKNLSLATTLLRYGILPNLELRLESSYESTKIHYNEINSDSSYSGMGPLAASFKVFVCEEKGIRPQLAIIGAVVLRHLGHDSYKPTFSYPIGKLAASHTLSKRWSLGYNIGFAYDGETADGFFVYSLFTGYAITSKLWTFVELYGNFDNGNFPNHKLDGGFTYLLRNNLQIDLTGGYGLDTDVNRFFINGGISWRIPR